MDRRVSDLWSISSACPSLRKHSGLAAIDASSLTLTSTPPLNLPPATPCYRAPPQAPSMMSLRQRHLDAQLTAGSQRDLNRSDSDSSLSLSLSQASEQQRSSSSSSRSHPAKPASLLHDTPNGGNRLPEGGAWGEGGVDSPLLMKKAYGLEKSVSLGEINSSLAGLSQSESSRSLSPNSTEPDTPSPTGGQAGSGGAAGKGLTRIPQLSSKKSPLEEDSGSTGEDTDSAASRKKHTFKIFKKQKK